MRRFTAARSLLLDGCYSYYGTYKCGVGYEVGDFATREEAEAKAAELNQQPGHRAVPKHEPFTRCGFCGGSWPCTRCD